MKSTASYFKFNKNVFAENIKRFWAIPVLYTLFIFLSCIFPIMMSYDKIDKLGYYRISYLLTNQNPFTFIFLTPAPLAAAVIIFRYLQANNSTAALHAMPFTRQELFFTHCISGILLTIIPIIVNGLILLAIKTPVYNNAIPPENIFTTSAVMDWIWLSILIIILNFSVAVFAGIISGTSILHSILGFDFLFLLPAIGVVLTFYIEKFLFGFYLHWGINQFIEKLSPVVAILSSTELSSGFIIFYIMLTVFLFAASCALYLRRKLERATDTIAFNFLKPLFKYGISFCGMTVLGIYLLETGQNKITHMYIGFFIGSIISYLIAEMILQKSIWVFKNLKGYLIYLIIAAIFIVCIQTDILGYERRLPEIENISGISYNRYAYLEEKPALLVSPEIIEATHAFHKSIIDNRKWLENHTEDYSYNILLNYKLKNGKLLTRHYQLPYAFFENNPYIKTVYESHEYKKAANELFDVDPYNLAFISMQAYFLSEKNIRLIDSVEISEFIEVLKKDILNESFGEMLGYRKPLASIDFMWKPSEESHDKYLSASVKKSYLNTINWLRAKGYLDAITVSPEDVQYISVEKYHNEVSAKEVQTFVRESHTVPEATPDIMVITDRFQIAALLENFEDNYRQRKNGYLVSISFYNGHIYSGYYNKDKIPEFICKYFENNKL